MKRTLLATLTAAAVLALAAGTPWAQAPAPAGAPAPKAAAGTAPAFGYQMMTPAERDAWHQSMIAAKTPEERESLRAAHHALMMQRAEEQGIALAGPRGDPQFYGQQLMTPAERAAFMDKMRAAATPDERIKLRDAHRAEMQKRAQEKGITLPEPRNGMGGGMGPRMAGGMGPGMGPGMGGPGAGRGMRGPGAGGAANPPGPPATAPSGPAGK